MVKTSKKANCSKLVDLVKIRALVYFQENPAAAVHTGAGEKTAVLMIT